MIEYLLIKIFLRKKEFDSYYQYVSKVENRELQKILYSIKELHETGKEEYTVDELELCFYGEYPALKPAEKDMYSLLFKKIREAEADHTLIEKYLTSHKESQLAHRVASVALEVYEGRKGFPELQELLKTLDAPNPITEEEETLPTSLTELLEEYDSVPGFKWRLNCLNKSLGYLRKGTAGHIMARIETGKTAMWVSELTYMVQQMGGDQVADVFFNEEDGKGTMLRIYCAMLGKTEREIMADREAAEREFNEKGGWRIKFYDRPTLTKKFVESVLEKDKPALIIIDNPDKMRGFEADRKDMILADIFKWLRELGKTYAPLISVGQADATAHNKKWVDESQMADGKTGKPSETDFTIGIGKTQDEGMSFVRHIYISRNKCRGGPETIPELRHGKFDVIIRPELSIYEDIVD